jgi:hypothetical protein
MPNGGKHIKAKAQSVSFSVHSCVDDAEWSAGPAPLEALKHIGTNQKYPNEA